MECTTEMDYWQQNKIVGKLIYKKGEEYYIIDDVDVFFGVKPAKLTIVNDRVIAIENKADVKWSGLDELSEFKFFRYYSGENESIRLDVRVDIAK